MNESSEANIHFAIYLEKTNCLMLKLHLDPSNWFQCCSDTNFLRYWNEMIASMDTSTELSMRWRLKLWSKVSLSTYVAEYVVMLMAL